MDRGDLEEPDEVARGCGEVTGDLMHRSDWHLHGRDYVTVIVESNGALEAQFGDGTVSESGNSVGDFTYHDSHVVHRVVNNTDKRYKNVLIELK